MTLKAKQPEAVKPSKPKFLISGVSGIGKTFFSLDFPKPYFIDCEGGATREQYQKKLKDSGGVYLGKEEGSQDFDIIINEIKSLITEKHNYKTLVIDSFSYLYLLEAAKAEEKLGNDFGRDKKEANKPTRQLIRWLEKLDMTVILICHSKDKWERTIGNNGKEQIVNVGSTFDGWEKLEYILDLWIEIVKGLPEPIFQVKKSRIDSFREGSRMPLKYEQFASLYGKDIIEKEVIPIPLATKEQVEEVKSLLEIVKVDPKDIEKWMDKADVDKWEDFNSEQITKIITFLNKKIEKKGK